MPITDIETEFESRGIKRGGILFLRRADAEDLISRAQERNVPILGIDAFVLADDRTEPTLEYSKDFSRDSLVDTWSAATRTLSAVRDLDLYFEVVLGAQNEDKPD